MPAVAEVVAGMGAVVGTEEDTTTATADTDTAGIDTATAVATAGDGGVPGSHCWASARLPRRWLTLTRTRRPITRHRRLITPHRQGTIRRQAIPLRLTTRRLGIVDRQLAHTGCRAGLHELNLTKT
jgi:hypothetical protein